MEQNSKQRRLGRWKMLAVLAVCASPLIASYFTYYVIKPSSRTNYGTLLDPRQYPVPRLGGAALDGKPVELDAFQGKWQMLQIDSGACRDACRNKLHDMRQLRTAQGKERDRLQRVWLVTDNEPVDPALLQEYEGTRVLRVPPAALQAWLPVEQGASLADHIYMIDPLGNLMMRFPKDADPNRIRKDLGRLLKASKIG